MNRYDVLLESDVTDPVSDEKFPDPLSYNYNKFIQTSELSLKSVNAPDLNKFWYFISKAYDNSYEGDLILNLNNIPWRGNLEPGDMLVFPAISDMIGMIVQQRDDLNVI